MDGICIRKNNWTKYCDAVGDYNPIHRNLDSAIEYGLEKEVAPGMFIASHIQGWPSIQRIQNIEFKKGVHDGDKVELVALPNLIGKSINYEFHRGEELICRVTGVTMGRPDGKMIKPLDNFVHKYSTRIDPCRVGHFFRSMSWSPEEGLPNMYLASLSAPALLDMVSSLGFVGMHRSQSFNSHISYEIGSLDVLIGEGEEKILKNIRVCDYPLQWIQKDKVIACGESRVFLNGKSG